MRCQKKIHRRYASGHDRRSQISYRRTISERLDSIEKCSHIGYWEGDTAIGEAHKNTIETLDERKSGYAVVSKVNRKTAEELRTAIDMRLKLLASRIKMIS